ncbi:MAG TPA: phosphoribosylglycinamide formyltransferase [Solirubrobacterales bacterium]|nr:phosphoribosylglycinamide formyltransferase [Solirubrobacterales bacterium]
MLISGAGTNLQAILDQVHGRDGIEVDVVVSNRADAGGLERARAAGVETAVFEASDYRDRAERDREMAAYLAGRGIRLVVLAGYMQLLDPQFIAQFPQAVINVHPALLPAFPGSHPIEDQIAYGVKISGVTVHFVDDGVDTGPIILQEAVRLPYTRDDKEILGLLHRTEHRLLPRAIRLIAQGAVSVDEENPRLVRVEEGAQDDDG